MMTPEETPDSNIPFANDLNRTRVIPVIEEHLQVRKEVVETGRIRIGKRVYEEEQTVSTPLISEKVDVERVAVGEFVDTLPEVRYEGDTMIIPVVEEVVVVEKRLRLVEELRVTRQHIETTATEQITLRKEEVTVERLDPEHPVD